MANECLNRKLKSVVNKDNLPVFGCIKIHVNANTSGEDNVRQVKLKSNIAYKITAPGNYLLYNGGSAVSQLELTANASSTAHVVGFVAGEYDVYVEKYGLTSIEGGSYSTLKQYSIDMSQFEFSPLSNIALSNVPISGTFKTKVDDISSLVYNTGDSSMAVDNSIVDTSIFAGCSLSSIDVKAKNFAGSIDNLNTITGNITLQGIGSNMLMTGDIKTFVEYMASHGVQNAVYTFKVAKTTTTLYHNGSLFTYTYVASQGGSIGVKYTITNGVLGSPEWV